jgi:sugar phosphate isomerase/epimerase
MKIGIRGHDVLVSTPNKVAYVIKQAGFDYVQLVVNKALLDNDNRPLKLNDDNVIMISDAFKNNEVKIAMLGCYFNPVHSNKEKVNDSIKYFIKHLELACHFNCKYVGTETGSFNDDKWTYNPLNHTKEAFNQVVDVFKVLVDNARKYNSIVLVEPAYNHVIYNARVLNNLLNIINDEEHLQVTIDIYNLLNIDNYFQYKEIFLECLKMFNSKIRIIHLKDFAVEEGKLKQTDLGSGYIDFAFIFKAINDFKIDACLIFEGITGEGIKKSLDYIRMKTI